MVCKGCKYKHLLAGIAEVGFHLFRQSTLLISSQCLGKMKFEPDNLSQGHDQQVPDKPRPTNK